MTDITTTTTAPTVQLIFDHFPNLTDVQRAQFTQLQAVYLDWNTKINLISRKDFDQFYERHVLHSLAIAKYITFVDGTAILDVGTGGGFPGIPLAILFPNCSFTLVDSIGKKIMVVNEVAKTLGLTNVTGINDRVENIKQKFDFVVSRAVTAFPEFHKWVRTKGRENWKNELPNGIIYLKGGDLSEELKGFLNAIKVTFISDYFAGEFFESKKIIYMKL